ncbi:MAG: DUF349 domain-containing protein [Nocardiopsaceae bacterium]|nr:DUF349 domain-containing protein [Nocardiopsaceae bacterium]
MTSANDPWGRVDADGTVYVRTAEGERVIGSWAAGSPEEALEFFRRKFQSLETEVSLLEQRLAATDIAPGQAQAAVSKLLAAVSGANAIGDLDSLKARLEALTRRVEQRRGEVKAAREHAREAARDVKERIVAEAERIAVEATHWKASGERMAQLLEEWKAAPHADRSAEAVLWKRLSAARNQFTKRRKAYFSNLEAEREQVRQRKEELVAEAEALSDSTDWGATASAYRDLMQAWKEAGRAGRDAEAELWKRFRGAQDKFFGARSEAFAARDAEFAGNAEVKEEILAEAQALLPVRDIRATRTALRAIQERWEAAGPVPRDQRDRLESGLRKVEDALRRAEDNQWKRTNPEALARAESTVNQIKAAITSLEAQLAKAQQRGDEAGVRDAEEALTARREWLVEAERTLAEFSS